MRYKLLIFDLDNTVFDYNKAENYALEKTLARFNCPSTESLKESYRVINEQTWQQLEQGDITSEELRVMRFEKFADVHNLDWNAAEVSSIYLENLGLGGFLVNGADPLLFDLKKDFRLASVTNGISDVQRARLSNSPFDGFFDPLIISDEVGVAKPNPGIFEILLDKSGITDKKSVLMIGDSLSSDIAGAAAAGIDSCWFNPSGIKSDGSNPADYVITELTEIKDIVYRKE